MSEATMNEDPTTGVTGPSSTPRLTRRRAGAWLAAGATTAGAVALAGCGAAATPSVTKTGDLGGTFTFSVQNFQPTINIIDRAIPVFQQKHPAVKITYTPVAFGEMAAKTAAEVAGGSGHDGFHTYTGFWRGKDASSIMLPLTPVLFKKPELEQIFFASSLADAVWSKKPEIYIMPFACGVNGSMLLWHSNLAAGAGVDPRTATSLVQDQATFFGTARCGS